jgi:hypothetical protein
MRVILHSILMGISMLALANVGQAQAPGKDSQPNVCVIPAAAKGGPEDPQNEQQPGPQQEHASLGQKSAELRQRQTAMYGELANQQVSPGPPEHPPQNPAQEQVVLEKEIAGLRQQQLVLAQAEKDDKLKKQLEIQTKQIETLEKMVRLLRGQMTTLRDQINKQPPPGAAVEKLELQVATLAARSQLAANRDKELANAVDDIREHADAEQRYGPQLPAPLKELFLPSGTNETPLSIYGALSVGYSKIIGDSTTAANGAGRPSTPGGFYFGEFTPDFLLKLNDWIFLEAEIGIGPSGSVSAGAFAQADFFVNDWLTIIAGRFVAPIGFYNERLNNPWVNKLPTDAPGSPPLLWLQVLPAFSMLGVQAQGSFYLGCSPIKMEYNAYISNGLNLKPATAGAPTINELANLENMESTFSLITNDKAVGGRIGLWWPECGLAGGISGMYNGDYVAGGSEDSISLWAVDLNYHKGNWDLRAEYGMTYQHAQSFIANNIRRQGFYAQAAYRPRDCPNQYLQNVELVYRYGYVDFRGIDPTTLDLTTFGTPIDVPTRRQQNEFGINYYFYPRMVLKCAYQINDEPGFHLHDNQFIAELDWGW